MENNETKEVKKNTPTVKNKSIFQYIDHSRSHLYLYAGSSGSGKSHCMRFMLIENLRKGFYDCGLVFSGSDFNNDYDFLPSKYIINGYNEEILKKFIEFMKKNKGSFFVVFDDLVGLIKYTPALVNFLTSFRHYNCDVYIATQYLQKVQPIIRIQATYAFIYKQFTSRAVNSAFESYGVKFENVKEFKKFLEKHTNVPYSSLVFIQKINDYIEYLAPKSLPNIKFEY
jgi:Cdc6-like AAA superfamily ATPase